MQSRPAWPLPIVFAVLSASCWGGDGTIGSEDDDGNNPPPVVLSCSESCDIVQGFCGPDLSCDVNCDRSPTNRAAYSVCARSALGCVDFEMCLQAELGTSLRGCNDLCSDASDLCPGEIPECVSACQGDNETHSTIQFCVENEFFCDGLLECLGIPVPL